jgi:aspartate-semialdehyde dehydrogenase
VVWEGGERKLAPYPMGAPQARRRCQQQLLPMPKDTTGEDAILVGRIRQDLSDPSGCSFALFAAGDQLLKGAALNAVQIAEALLHK